MWLQCSGASPLTRGDQLRGNLSGERLLSPGEQGLNSLDRDQPPPSNLDRAEGPGGDELVERRARKAAHGDRLINQIDAALAGAAGIVELHGSHRGLDTVRA